MEASVWRRLAGVFVVSLALVACGSSGDQSQADVQGPDDTGAEPPNEGVILAQELAQFLAQARMAGGRDVVLHAARQGDAPLGQVVVVRVGLFREGLAHDPDLSPRPRRRPPSPGAAWRSRRRR